jgi:hypothetical protein
MVAKIDGMGKVRDRIGTVGNYVCCYRNSWLYLLAICCVFFLSSCAGGGLGQSANCRGFDFDKEFPGDDHRPISVWYDLSYAWATGNDGLNFTFYYRHDRRDRKHPFRAFNGKDIPLSSREKEYIAAYESRELEFDRKYAGWIKKKVLAVPERHWIPPVPGKAGRIQIDYPYYLVGDKLPDGLETPASFFATLFFERYIVALHRSAYIKDYVISVKAHKSAYFYDGVAAVGADIGDQVRYRFKEIFAEYVLTYYYLKQYATPEQRSQIVQDLADYYSDVAFRAAAESMYAQSDKLSGRDRCKIANYVAGRIRSYIITAFKNPMELQRIKEDYDEDLRQVCFQYLEASEYPMFTLVRMNKTEETAWVKWRNGLREEVNQGITGCVND